MPADTVPTRSLDGVVEVRVSVQSPPTTPPPSAGAITVDDGSRTVVLSARRLALLPAQTLNVSFGGPGGIQHHTETGPRLSLVLAVAVAQPRLAAAGDVKGGRYVSDVTDLYAGRFPLG